MKSAGQGPIQNNSMTSLFALGLLSGMGQEEQDAYFTPEQQSADRSDFSQISAAIAEAPEEMRARNDRFVAANDPHVVVTRTLRRLERHYPMSLAGEENLPTQADAFADQRAVDLAKLGFKVTVVDCGVSSDFGAIIQFPTSADGRMRVIDMRHMKRVSRFDSVTYGEIDLGKQLALFLYGEARRRGQAPWQHVAWYDAHGTAGAFIAQVVEKAWDVLRTKKDIEGRFSSVLEKTGLRYAYPGDVTVSYGNYERPLFVALGSGLVGAWRSYCKTHFYGYHHEVADDLAKWVAGNLGWSPDQVAEFLRVYDLKKHGGFSWNLDLRLKPGTQFDNRPEDYDREVAHDLGKAFMRVVFGENPPRFGRELKDLSRIVWTPSSIDREHVPYHAPFGRIRWDWIDKQKALLGDDIWLQPGAESKIYDFLGRQKLPRLSPVAAIVAQEPETLPWARGLGMENSMQVIGDPDTIQSPEKYVRAVHAILSGGAAVYR